MLMMAKMAGMLGAGDGGATDYAGALAAIPNKTLILRGDSSSAANGTALSSSQWSNEGSGGGTFTSGFGSPTWETNSQNGMRGVLCDTSNEALANTTMTLSTMLGGTRDCTIFVVGKIGAGAAANDRSLLLNGISPSWEMGTSVTYEFFINTNNGGLVTVSSGLFHTPGSAFAVAVRVNSAGNVRFNLNGAVANFASSLPDPTSTGFSQTMRAGRGSDVTPLRNYEYVVSSDAVSDDLMDNFIIGLKTKWGIA